MTADSQDVGLGKSRMNALSDGIFAVALTVLVLDIKPSQLISATDWWSDLWPRILTFIASFLILGLYWIAHHNECRLIRKTDRWMLWLNLLFLLSIVFVPFSTGILGMNWQPNGDHWQQRIPIWTYASNLVLVGLTLEALWRYAGHRQYFDHSLYNSERKTRVAETTIRNLFAPCLYLVIILLSIFSIRVSRWFIVVVPFLYIAYLVWSAEKGLIGRAREIRNHIRPPPA